MPTQPADKTSKRSRSRTATDAKLNSVSPGPTPAERSRRNRAESGTLDENAIRERHAKAKAVPSGSPTAKTSDEPDTPPAQDSRAVPEHIHARYIKVGHQYHFTNGDFAFADRGRNLSTRLENTEVIQDLISIAKERGWNDIALKGSERFRKEAWQQAHLAGLTARGYRPTDLERAQLVRLMGRGRDEGREEPPGYSGAPQERSTSASMGADEAARAEARSAAPAPDRVQAGRLIDHGAANYQFDRHAGLSYFVKLETPEGERTLWGKDLERALERSLSRASIGNEVLVRQLGAKPVTVIRPIRDEAGRIIERTQVQKHLNRWSVERADFLTERAQVAEIVRDPSIDARTGAASRPELAGTYTELHAAKLVAQELFIHPADQERFVTRVREAIADEIERGEPLSAPRIKSRARGRPQHQARTPERAQERVLS
jgi:hypothetical protein